MIRRVFIWTMHERFERIPACCFLRDWSSFALMRLKIILDSTLDIMERSVIVLQFLHWEVLRFFGRSNRVSPIQTAGIFSSTQMKVKSGSKRFTVYSGHTFRVSAWILSYPGDLLFLGPLLVKLFSLGMVLWIVDCDAIFSDVLVLGELIISVNCSLNLLNCSFLVVNKVASFDLIKRGLHDLYR